MNLRIRRVTAVLLGLYGLLFIQLNVVQLVKADTYNAHPANTREIVRQFGEPRGTIRTADGVVVAQTVDVDNNFERLREYPHADLYAHVTGYISLNQGAAGLERQLADVLTGDDAEIELQGLSDLFVESDRTGNVTLTIDHDVQRVARAALGEREGAVVAIDVHTGAILAMYSWPTFDPGLISSHNLAQAAADKATLDADPENPLRSRAFQERYPPGSTFKVVTAAAALESGAATPTSPVFDFVAEFTPPQTDRPIGNFGGSTCGGDLTEMLRVSCNTGFAELAIDMGASPLIETAERFGFNNDIAFDLDGAVESTIPNAGFYDDNQPLLAQSAIGQFEVAASPLQMVLVAAAIANDGVQMRPYVVASVDDSDGKRISTTEPEVGATPIEVSTARELTTMMEVVATTGTARNLGFDGVPVAGKTGTAERGPGEPTDAWLIGFAPANAPRVAVAVLLQADVSTGDLTGGQDAAPIAREVLKIALEQLG